MNYEEYINVYFEKKQIRLEMKRIQKKSCQLETYSFNIISLSFFDGKQYLLDDGIKTLA